MKNKIRMADPWITEFEIKIVEDMMKTGWDNYKYVEKFEPEFARYHDRKFGIMTPCCTHALHLLLLSLGIKDGDEVIAPECTWTASVAPIIYERAIPIFCDIDPKNWCLDANSVRKRINEKTKAIIAVDLYGNMPEMGELEKISKETGIPLIEDSAEALGSVYNGVRAGKFGIGSVFSFHRTKTITTGEGGMLITDDENIKDRAKFLRDHGRHPTIPYYTVEASPKYMPSNLQAALGWAQLQRIEQLVQRKRDIFHKYLKEFSDFEDLQFNLENENLINGAWATSLVIGKKYNKDKKEIMRRLEEMGLPIRPFFYPLSSLPAYRDYKTGSKEINPNSYDISERGITLPCSFHLSDEDIKEYSDAVKKIITT